MADQQRWFKFWCTAPYDDHLQRLSIADRWAWAVLGAYTKAHGTRGHVSLSASNAALAGAMGIPVTDLVTTVARLPHIEMVQNGHGDFSVTWHNWTKYQEDTTQAERKRASRAKKRGDEKRGDEIRTSPPVLQGPPLPEPDRKFLDACPEPYRTAWLNADWWVSLEDGYPKINRQAEASRYLAHQLAKPIAQRHRNVRQGFRNWLATADRWRQRDEDRKAVRRR